jgi:signal transduction histidine kinase
VDRNLIKRLVLGHAGIALVIAVGTVTAVLALRAGIRQNDRASEIDRRLVMVDHLRADAREIARSARRYLLTGDGKEQQRVFALEKELDDERTRLGPSAREIERVLDNYVSSVVRSMTADRTNAAAALADFENQLMLARSPLVDAFDQLVSRERAERRAARTSHQLARGAQWALAIAACLGLLLTVSCALFVLRLVRSIVARTREADLALKRAAASRKELLASSRDLRTPLQRIIIQTAQMRICTREPHQLELLQSIASSATQVDYLLRDLLDATALQAGTASLRRERSDVATLVDCAIRQHRNKAQQRGTRLRYEPPLSLSVYVDRERFTHALASLIGAVLESAHGGTEIVVTANPSPDGVRFVIADVATVPTPETFQSPPAAGANELTLHVAQRVIEAHGGRLEADADGRSYSFTLSNEPNLLR